MTLSASNHPKLPHSLIFASFFISSEQMMLESSDLILRLTVDSTSLSLQITNNPRRYDQHHLTNFCDSYCYRRSSVVSLCMSVRRFVTFARGLNRSRCCLGS